MSEMNAQQVFDAIAEGIKSDPSLTKTVGGVFHFKVNGKSYTVDLKNAPGSVKAGAPEKEDCTITISEADFVQMMLGKANGQNLFMQGKLKIGGNMGLAMKLEKIPKVPTGAKPAAASGAAAAKPAAASSAPAASAASGGLRASAVFEQLAKTVAASPALLKSIGAVYQFDIKGADGAVHSWTVDLKNGSGSVKAGKAEKADCTLTVADDDFVGMMTGKLNSQQLFMQGKLKIGGNMGVAMKLGQLQQAKASL